jgi:ornithine cyclodeaminase/alanine dehydrogenase-like protein (mu-crystallin family)
MEAATMTGSVLHIGSAELWSMLGEINPVGFLTDELTGHGPANGDRPRSLESGPPVEGLATVEDVWAGRRCRLPVSGLHAIRTAAIAALAARELLATGAATLGIIGPDPDVYLCLAVIARHVFDIGHAAVCPVGEGRGEQVEPAMREQFERAGVGLLVTDDMREAVFGANLVVVASDVRSHLEVGQLGRGALLVNATGQDLPDDVVDNVDQIYVDDTTQLERHRHRYFVKRHLAGTDGCQDRLLAREGWHRHRDVWRHRRRIETDLRQVLAGEHPGRTHLEDILLVEPLRAAALDAALAGQLHRKAVERGLGVWLPSTSR